MKYLSLFTVLAISLFALTACIPEEDYSTSSSSGSGGGGDTDALAGSTSTYSWTCPSGSTGSVSVTNGPCKSSQQNYAYVFSCNLVNDMRSACNSFYSCAVNNSTGDYRAYYQQYLDACAAY